MCELDVLNDTQRQQRDFLAAPRIFSEDNLDMKVSPKNPPVGRRTWSSLSLSAFQNSPATKDTVWGVSASFLEQFFERAVKQSSAWRQGMTTRAVVASIIKPLTEASNAPYIVVAERIRGEPIRKPAVSFPHIAEALRW